MPMALTPTSQAMPPRIWSIQRLMKMKKSDAPIPNPNTSTAMAVIPEGVGPVNPGGVGLCGCFFLLSGRSWACAGEVSGSRWSARSAARTYDLDPDTGWRRLCPGREQGWGCCGAAVLQRPMWTVGDGQAQGVWSPVIPSPPAWVAWSGAAAAGSGSIRYVDLATAGGGHTAPDLATWLRPDPAHAGRAGGAVRQRMCPSRRP
jgi:hypothetical protein